MGVATLVAASGSVREASVAGRIMVDVPPEFSTQRPIVGRAADLSRLATMVGLDSAAPGRAAVLLAGDAGVGKTRMLAELRDRAQQAGWRVLVGHCLDFGDSALPYLPFSEVFGRLAAEAPGLAESVVDAHPAVARLMPGRRLLSDAGQSRTERMDRAELFEVVLAALDWLSRASPLLLLIEDMHWADPSTREMLSFLLTRRVVGPVSIVGSYRGDDLHRRHPLRSSVAEWARLPGVTRLQLRPLADTDMRELVRGLHPAPLSEGDVRGIVERAEGNPFFAEELVAATELGGRALPTDLADVLLVRLDRLDDAARQVVRAASVAGRRVSHELLARVLGPDGSTSDPALRAAVESNVLVPAGADGYAFRHALLAEAVYDDLLSGERIRLHAAYAEALSSRGIEGTAAELARHARAAHDVGTAIRASIQAGDEAMAVAGPDEAAHHYEVALELVSSAGAAEAVGQDVDVVQLAVRASDAAAAAGHVFRAVTLVQDQPAQLPYDAPALQRATLMRAIAGAALLSDTGIDVLALSTDALQLVPAEPPSPLRAQLLSLHARANAERYRHDVAARWAGEALRLARDLALPDVVADATTTLARLDERAGDPEASRRTLEQAVAAARAGGEFAAELRGMASLGGLRYEAGDLAGAYDAYRATADRAREMGRPWAPYGVDARAMSGIVAYVAGDWEGVIRIVDVAGESPPAMAEAALAAAGLAVAAGRGEQRGLALVDQLRPWWERDGMIALLAGGAAIDLYGDVGDLAAAAAVYGDVVACVSRLWGNASFQARIRLGALMLGQLCAVATRSGTREAAELVVQGGHYADAATAAVDQVASDRGRRGPESDAWVARVTAELARLRWLAGVGAPPEDQLVETWRLCVAAFERFGHVFEVARSRARLAAVLRATGHPAEARELAEQGRATARRLGAAPLLTELRSLGAGTARRAAPTRPNSALTPREQEVLALVAQGRSNRDIGQRLYISAKTVSVHVSSILAKLGAGGRTEAVALARRGGLLSADRAP